jgi:hypothetical protein
MAQLKFYFTTKSETICGDFSFCPHPRKDVSRSILAITMEPARCMPVKKKARCMPVQNKKPGACVVFELLREVRTGLSLRPNNLAQFTCTYSYPFDRKRTGAFINGGRPIYGAADLGAGVPCSAPGDPGRPPLLAPPVGPPLSRTTLLVQPER